MEIRRGEIWLANLSPTQGTEQAGIRPVLIIQTDRANPHSPHTVIVPFTTKIGKLDETTICIVISIYPRKTRNIQNSFRTL